MLDNDYLHNGLRLTLIEHDEYTRTRAQYDEDLVSDVESAFSLPLANNPYYGDIQPEFEDIYVFHTQAFRPRVPDFRVTYRYSPDTDPTTIELLAIAMVDNESSEENGF